MRAYLLMGIVLVGGGDGLTRYEAMVRLRNHEYQKVIVPARNPQNAKEMLFMQWCPKTNNCIVTGPSPVR